MTLMPSSGAPVVLTAKAHESALGSELAGRCLEPVRGHPTHHPQP